ncbi:hypothetical protein SDC9_159370 [bioreactor metagenome]|uniref:Uncharacterized protein n=1 Tax=bioreactor metagenome TaxID=1076179 RepID=A0A645FDM1_9ZZZZ
MILERCFAAVQAGHFAHQRQAEAGALAAGSGAGQGIEAVEQLRQGVVGGALAVVVDGEHNVFAVVGSG